MNPTMLQILYPIWIGIAFNLAMTAFNVIGMIANLRGSFVDWYLEKGGFKIMAIAWAFFISWSIFNGVTAP